MSPDSFMSALTSRADLEQYGSNARLLFILELNGPVEDIHTVAADALTDGTDDKKCDLIYVSEEDGRIVVGQGYEAQDDSRDEAPSNKAADLNTAAGWLLSRALNELPEQIKSAASQVRSALENGKIRTIEFWYVHNLPESANVRSELDTVELTVRNAVGQLYPESGVERIAAIEIGRSKQESLYRSIESPVLVTDDFAIEVPGGYAVESGEWSAYVTAVPAVWLHDAHRQYQSDLFSANVRDYLGSRRSDKNINNGIKTSAKDTPDRFWVYNNGITALVHDFRYSEADGVLHLSGLSIVNGAQTTGSIGALSESPSDSAMVPARFVKCSDLAIIKDIIRYNNSQNRVEATDFRSNDSVQRRLRTEFEGVPDAQYTGGRRGGAEDVIRRPANLLSAETCAQAIASFHQEPTVAYHEKSRIWQSDALYARYFNESTTARHIVFVYSLLRAVEKKKKNLVAANGVGDGLAADQMRQLEYFRQRGSNHLLVAAIGQCTEALVNRAVPDRFRLSFGAQVSPAVAIETWLPVVEVVCPFVEHLQRAAVGAIKKTEDVTEGVRVFGQMVRATRTANAALLDEFAAKVVVD